MNTHLRVAALFFPLLAASCASPGRTMDDSPSWKTIYKQCVTRKLHASPQLAMYVDLGALSDRCKVYAEAVSGRR